MSAENQEVPEEVQSAPPATGRGKPRTQKQLEALAKAREKALVARRQYAEDRKSKQVEASRPPSPEPEPEPEPEPQVEEVVMDDEDFFESPAYEEAAPPPAPAPQMDEDAVMNIIHRYKAEKKRRKDEERASRPKEYFQLHPSGYYIYSDQGF